MNLLISGLVFTIVIFVKFGESSRRQENFWNPPTPENNDYFNAHEAERLLNELDSSQHSHSGDFEHHTPMHLTHAAHTNQNHQLVPRPQESPRRQENVWNPPTPENNDYFNAHEAERLLNELDSSEHSHSWDFGHHTSMHSTHAAHTNQNHQLVPRPQKLNSMEGERSNSASIRRRGRPTGRLTTRVDGIKRGAFHVGDSRPLPVDGPPTESVIYMGKAIMVWLNPTTNRVLKADFPENYFPIGSNFYQHNDFLVRRTFVKYGDMVQYIWANETLMGIRAPKPTRANIMEPSETTWFIVCQGKYFRLTVNPETKLPVEIELIPKNTHDATHFVEDVEVAGIKFKVFSGGPDFSITGAELRSRRSPSPEATRRPTRPTFVHNFRDLIS